MVGKGGRHTKGGAAGPTGAGPAGPAGTAGDAQPDGGPTGPSAAGAVAHQWEQETIRLQKLGADQASLDGIKRLTAGARERQTAERTVEPALAHANLQVEQRQTTRERTEKQCESVRDQIKTLQDNLQASETNMADADTALEAAIQLQAATQNKQLQ